jgi:hypothetical protein
MLLFNDKLTRKNACLTIQYPRFNGFINKVTARCLINAFASYSAILVHYTESAVVLFKSTVSIYQTHIVGGRKASMMRSASATQKTHGHIQNVNG